MVGEASGPFVSVIIPVYNDTERLVRCLRALYKQTYPPDRYEIIVVDNASADDVAAEVGGFPRVRVAFEPQPGSYAARNHGVTLAQGDIIAFTDSDCVPAADWISTGVDRLESIPRCGLVAGSIRIFFQQPERPTAVELYDSITAFRQKKSIEQARFGVTANLFIHGCVLDDVGLFDATLQSGGDREWGQRVHAAEYRQVYAPEVRVSHPARSSLRDLHSKIARVVVGHHKLSKESDSRPTWRGFLRRIFPPVRVSYHILRTGEIRGARNKTKVLAVAFAEKYLRTWELVRLTLGRHPKSTR